MPTATAHAAAPRHAPRSQNKDRKIYDPAVNRGKLCCGGGGLILHGGGMGQDEPIPYTECHIIAVKHHWL